MSEGFELRGDRITTRELMKLLGVSDQTITNYVREGMPVAGTGGTGRKSGRYFDGAACLAWVKEHKPGWQAPGVGRGGKRDGAGRKPKNEDRPVLGDDVPLTEGEKDLLSDERKQREILSRLSGGEGLIAVIREFDVSPRLAKTLNELLQTATRQNELEKSMGNLLEKRDVEQAWMQVLAEVDSVLSGLAAAVVRDVGAKLGLTAPQLEVLREAVTGTTGRARGILANRDARGLPKDGS